MMENLFKWHLWLQYLSSRYQPKILLLKYLHHTFHQQFKLDLNYCQIKSIILHLNLQLGMETK